VRDIDVEPWIGRLPAGGVEEFDDRPTRRNRELHPPPAEIGLERGDDLAVEVGHEHGRRGLLPADGQPRDGLFVGGDRVACALPGDHEPNAEGRIDALPEGDVDDLLQSLFGGLVRGVDGLTQVVGDGGQSCGHLRRGRGGPKVHPGRCDLALVEQRPADLAAGFERAGVERFTNAGIDSLTISRQRQSERRAGLQ
jgi:hypothetical protein